MTRISRIGTDGFLKNDALPFQGVSAEVHEQTKTELGGGEVVQDLLHVGVGEGIDGFRFEQDFVSEDEVSPVVVRKNDTFVAYFVFLLTAARNVRAAQFHHERIFVNDFVVALAQLAMDFHAQPNQMMCLLAVKQFRHGNQFVIIRAIRV